MQGFVDRFVSLISALTHACLFILVLFPGLASVFYLVHDLRDWAGGQSMVQPDYLDAGAGQPMGLLLLHMLCSCALIAWLLQRRQVRPGSGGGLVLVALLLLAVCISSTQSEVRGEVWPATLSLAYGLAVYAMVLDRVHSPRIRHLIPRLLSVSGGLCGWVGLVLYVGARPEVLTGAFFQPNVMAGYLVMTLPVTLLLFATSPAPGWLVCALGQGAALLLTISRGGVLTGVLVVLGCVLAAAWVRVPRPVWRGLATWLLLTWALFAGLGSYVGGDGTFHLVPQHAVQRAENSRQEDVASVTARKAFYRAAWAIWREHPLWGVGLNAFNRYYPQHQDDFRWYSRYSHSMYLDWLCEGGGVAFVLFLAWLGWTAWRAWCGRQRTPEGLLGLGLMLGMAGSLIHSAVDVDWKFASLPMTFFILAAAVGAGARSGTGDPEADAPQGPGLYQLGAAAVLLVAFMAAFRFWLADDAQLLGAWCVQHDKPTEALGYLHTAVRTNPLRSDAYEGLIDLSLRRYDQSHDAAALDEASRFAYTGTQVDPHRSVLWSRLGQVATVAGHGAEAEAAEARALALDPVNFPDFYNRLATQWMADGRSKEAVALWQEAERRFPWSLVLETKSFRQDALRPQIVTTYLEYGTWLFGQKQTAPAMEQFKQALAIDPANPDALISAATAYNSLHQPDAAVPLLLHARDLVPGNAVVYLLLGSCYGQQGHLDKAREALQQAEKIDPSLKSQIDAATHGH